MCSLSLNYTTWSLIWLIAIVSFIILLPLMFWFIMDTLADTPGIAREIGLEKSIVWHTVMF